MRNSTTGILAVSLILCNRLFILGNGNVYRYAQRITSERVSLPIRKRQLMRSRVYDSPEPLLIVCFLNVES